nr:uncharacterized protein LOC124815824 [Hydra vulgaris]
MQITLCSRLIVLSISISICSTLKCYTCTSSSLKSCNVMQKLEKCTQIENTCLTIHHTVVIESGNKTLSKTYYLKKCAKPTQECKAYYCNQLLHSKECTAFCCNRDGCNKSINPIVVSAKHTSSTETLMPFFLMPVFLMVLTAVIMQYL